MMSVLSSMAKTGMSPPFSIRKDFQLLPKSLKKICRILNASMPYSQLENMKKIFDFTENDAQGITFGEDSIWYLASQFGIFKYSITGPDVFNPTVNRGKSVHLSHLIESIGLNPNAYDHIGGISYYDRLLFVPIRSIPPTRRVPIERRLPGDRPHLLLALSQDLEVVGYAHIPLEAWCAVHPWNRNLYLSDRQHRHHLLEGYDVSPFYDLLDQQNAWGNEVSLKEPRSRLQLFTEDGELEDNAGAGSIQSVYFSQEGLIFLARAVVASSVSWDNYINVYSGLTGIRLRKYECDFEGAGDELEGIVTHPGASGVLYLAVADNDGPFGGKDEFEVHAAKFRD